MAIKLGPFTGMLPRLDEQSLPDPAAADALDCELRDGVLEPLSLTGTVLSMHEDNGKLKAEIAAADLISITKPSKPGPVSKVKMWNVTAGLSFTIEAHVFRSYVRASDGNFVVYEVAASNQNKCTIKEVKHTHQGLFIRAALPNFESWTVTNAFIDPKIWGPVFRINLKENAANGGPDEDSALPPAEVAIAHTMKPIPEGAIQLVRNGRIYGAFQVIDYIGPNWTQDIDLGDAASIYHVLPNDGGDVAFVINLNYIEDRQRYYRFSRTNVDVDADGVEREGPPSELTDLVTVDPGEMLKLTVAWGNYQKQRIYRNEPGSDKYWLAGEIDKTANPGNDWTDTEDRVKPIELPPFGNYDRTGATAAQWLEGSVVHPSRFALAFYNSEDENTIFVSDVDRHHAWPDEWTIKADGEIHALALTGRAVLAWIGSKVYAINGGSPEDLFYNMDLLSESAPLLNKCGLCKIGGAVFYPTTDGLAMATGGGVEIVTLQAFDRKKWQAYEPAKLRARVIDGVIVLQHESNASKNLLVYLNVEGGALVSRWTDLTAGVAIWTSKRFAFDRPQIFDWAMLDGDGPATLIVRSFSESGVENPSTPMTDLPCGKLIPIEAIHSRAWQFNASTRSKIRSAMFYERKVIEASGTVRLNSANVELWEDVWLKYAEADRPVAGTVTAQGAGTVYIDFKLEQGGAWETVHTVAVEAAETASFTLPRALAASEVWRIGVRIESASPLTPVHVDSLTLHTRRVRTVGDTWSVFKQPGAIAPWRIEDYEIQGQGKPQSVTVQASKAVTIRLYRDNAQQVSEQAQLTPGVEYLFSSNYASRIGFDFGDDDGAVSEVRVNLDNVRNVGEGGVEISGDHCRGVKLAFANQGNWACGQVIAAGYNPAVSVKLLQGNTTVATVAVNSAAVFRLPRTMPDAAVWTLDVTGGAQIETIRLWPLVRVKAGRDLHFVRRDPGLAPWQNTIFELDGEVNFVSGQVFAKSYNQTLYAYLNRAAGGYAIPVTSNREFRIEDDLGDAGAIELGFGSADNDITELRLSSRHVEPISPAGVSLRKAEGVTAWRRRFFKFQHPGSFAVVRVAAADYAGMTLALKADGATALAATPIAGPQDLKLPVTLSAGRLWEMDLTHAGDIDEFVIVGRQRHPLQNGVAIIQRATDPWSWLGHLIAATRPAALVAARVIAERYPVKLCRWTDGLLVDAVEVMDERPFWLGRSRPERLWEIDVIAPEGTVVHEVRVAENMGKL